MTYSKKELLSLLIAAERSDPIKRITSPSDVVPALMKWARRKQEVFIVVTLSTTNEIIRIREITRGLVNRTVAHPREVFRPAIKDNATAIIVAHNHPSGSLSASRDDCDITMRLVHAGEVVGIQVLDHIIVSKSGFYSFTNEGVMP